MIANKKRLYTDIDKMYSISPLRPETNRNKTYAYVLFIVIFFNFLEKLLGIQKHFSKSAPSGEMSVSF